MKPYWSLSGLTASKFGRAAKKSNINKIQIFQSVTFRIITNAPFYVSNHTLHTDLRMNTVDETSKIL